MYLQRMQAPCVYMSMNTQMHAHAHMHTCALTYLCTHINGYIYKCTNLLLLLADNLPAAVRKGPSGVGKLPAAIGQ